MASPNGALSNSRQEADRDDAKEPQLTTKRQDRPSRSAAGKANARISAVALRETSLETEGNQNLLAETFSSGNSKRQDSLAWAEMESEPVRNWSSHPEIPPKLYARLMSLLTQAFFNGLLRDLGAKDVRVVEMFSVSADDVQLLPYVLASR